LSTVSSEFKLLDQRNAEDHKQIYFKIGREVDGLERDLKQELNSRLDKLDGRQFNLVKEVSETVGRKTITPLLISVLTLITMLITVFVMYVK
jgi:hypothetical protein